MENIKIRVWNKKEKDWLNLTDEIYLSENGDIMREEYIEWHGDQLRFCDSKPEFYIGIDDKNGENIFQKDYVKVDGEIYLIDWRGCGFWFIKEDDVCLMFDPKVYDLEIIGNIHENPDLEELWKA